ncbi:MAG: rod shape-determining protein MreD [Endomicrobiia bacterium]
MIFYFFIVLIALFLFILQVLFSLYIFYSNIFVEFLIISLIYFSLRYGSVFGEFYGFFCGLLLDTFSISIFGLRSLLFTIFGFLLGRLSKKIDETNIKVQVLLCLFILTFYYFFMFATSKIFYPINSAHIRFLAFLEKIVVNCFFAPLIFKLLDILTCRIEKWSGKANY